MGILVSGIAGFVGSTLARALLEHRPATRIVGLDNLSAPGSPTNVADLRARGIELFHGDLRCASDLESLPAADWVLDCAANPCVIAGVDGRTSSRQLVEHNLVGTLNLLEYCKRHGAGFLLLSTSRVYSIPPLSTLPLAARDGAFALDAARPLPPGITAAGVSEAFSTAAPVSLYGATKLASEALALEYGSAFGLPVWIDRCGVLAGAGQFGRPTQGIFAYWIHSWARRRPLKYIGFDGLGHQVRDCLHPEDLVPVLLAQMDARAASAERIFNLGGGIAAARSLRQLSAWCADRLGPHEVASDPTPRPFDLPWVVLDSTRAARAFGWRPARSVESILDEIAAHARAAPDWLDVSAPL
jgi:CDP-paratose 2-epimerase